MTQNITTYYIPQNLNITKGKIYELYYSKVSNLDLTSIIEQKNISLNGMLQPNKQIVEPAPSANNPITISPEEYNELLSLVDNTTKLYNQSRELVKKLTKGRTN